MISIPLDIPEVRVLETEITSTGDFLITVESTLGSATCHKCGRETTEFHSLDRWITLRHLPILDRQVLIRLRPKRYRCSYCSGRPTSTQRLDWYEMGSGQTKAYEQYLLLRLVNSTIEDVSCKEQVGYEAVGGVIDRYICKEVRWDEYESIEVLGLDEIALKKGHGNFVVIVTARRSPGRVSVLAVLEDRKKETVKQFLQGIPVRLKERIETVCTDMYDGFINAVKEVIPSATVVADRFHVAKKYRECADNLRKSETNRLKKEMAKQEYEEIKGAMWSFRKRPEDLKKEEDQLLPRLFACSPSLHQAYKLREELTQIFEQELTKAEATAKLKQWQEQVGRSELRCFDPFLTMLENWMDEITNYFLRRETSGFVEGINNKIKVLKRRCYGIFNLGHLFQRLFLDLEGYRLFAKPA
ncbi:MAG: ISL3 family transposase [Acidobacteria bacterium]|nr:ISL3 family transposase [Acidobacteriota bacterium]